MLQKLTLFILLLFSIFSCSSRLKEAKQENPSAEAVIAVPTATPPLEKGKILNPVFCVNDQTQSYAAYLPTTYDSSKKYPILFAFDAHAGGRIPVEVYKDLAEKYGYILVASNNSKNGLDWNLIHSIATTFMNDVKSRLSVDPKRIYLTGFSGGARVAASLALEGGIAGLASCSAGFDASQAMNFTFIGFAGSEDFNSTEMIELNRKLDESKVRHQLVMYDGKHDWPSAEVFENAFLWFDFNALKDKVIVLNAELITHYKLKQEAKIKTLQANRKDYEAYTESAKTVNFLTGLTDCSGLLSQNKALEKSVGVRKTVSEKATIEKREKALQDYYRQAIREKDVTWWLKEIDNLNVQAKSKQNSLEEYLMIKRTLSFLSLMTYMASNSTLNQNQFAQAAMYLQVYEKVDPENSEVYYLQALLAAKQQNTQAVIPALQKAVNAGFIDLERIEKEEFFNPVKQNAEYGALVEKIKAMK